ncbi:MAG: hypothetical protein KAX05_10185 [Bacteroidales bacterium]|nr:hypothetical protein [Bacteroidales bacterium]
MEKLTKATMKIYSVKNVLTGEEKSEEHLIPSEFQREESAMTFEEAIKLEQDAVESDFLIPLPIREEIDRAKKRHALDSGTTVIEETTKPGEQESLIPNIEF